MQDPTKERMRRERVPAHPPYLVFNQRMTVIGTVGSATAPRWSVGTR